MPLLSISHPSTEELADDLISIPGGLLRGMLIVLSVLGLPALVVAGFEAYELGQASGAMLYAGLYLLFLTVTFLFNRLPFALCSGVMLGCLFLVACFNLIHFSFAGAGVELYVTISVLATVLLGLRSGLIAAGICLAALIVIGCCFVLGVLDVEPAMPATTGSLVSWFTAAAVFALLGGALVLASGTLQDHLIRMVATVLRQTREITAANRHLSEEITQRKKTEEQLHQSETKFRTLFEMAPDALYLQDLQGVFLDGNKAAETLMAVQREAFIGKTFQGLNVLPEAEQPMALALLERNRRGESTGPDQLTLTNAEGKAVSVEIRTCPFQLGQQQVVFGIARDISERRRLQNQLHQSQKMEALGTLAGGIAHDFNNILSAVIGYTDIALSQTIKGDFMHESLTEVLAAGNRAKDLVGQILAISRHEDQQMQVLLINPLVKEALKMLRSTMPTSIEFRETIPSSPLAVFMNPTQLHQVIMNLATNAMQAMVDQEGVLTVSLDEVHVDAESDRTQPDLGPGRYARLVVSDTGKGIPKSLLDKIFEPYFTTKEKGTGTGLGLSVVQGIVKSHAGHLRVDSEPGQGSAFHVYLPLREEAAPALQDAPAGPMPGGSERILFVDDEASIAKMQEFSLGRLGYRVTAHTDSLEALETFRASPEGFDLLITDMTMPKMTGDKLAASVKELRPGIPVILCTGFSEKINVQSDNRNIDGFLMKPADASTMAATIRKVLDCAGHAGNW